MTAIIFDFRSPLFNPEPITSVQKPVITEKRKWSRVPIIPKKCNFCPKWQLISKEIGFEYLRNDHDQCYFNFENRVCALSRICEYLCQTREKLLNLMNSVKSTVSMSAVILRRAIRLRGRTRPRLCPELHYADSFPAEECIPRFALHPG
jgi:hypothetical protein